MYTGSNDNTRKKYHKIERKHFRPKIGNNHRGPLPIDNLKKELIESISSHQTTIVIGETGSGKSTQLPQFLIDDYINKNMNSKCIVCTQPRRVAAVTIAQRVAKERKTNLGDEVGYSIRFEDRSSQNTKIKYVTDGVLLREFINNSILSNYNIVILDEAHERSLQTDILMGMLKILQDKRNDFKIVVMSATLQIELFMNYFKDTNLVTVPGRQHPVSIYYVKEPELDFTEAAMLTCLQIHEEEESGGVLVFLPGQEDIENLQQMLLDNLPNIRRKKKQAIDKTSSNIKLKDDFVVFPLYASLSSDEQLKAFCKSEPGIRKFVLATNIAETSVTIAGIKYVIDTGYFKSRLIQSSTGMEMLKVLPISQSQANQRAGRAGRESSGKCFRLYTEDLFESLEVTMIPEIQRVNLSQVMLQLKLFGQKSIQEFPFISEPDVLSLRNALEDLLLLEAIDNKQELTNHGRRMASLPLTPIFANLLLKSEEFKCTKEILIAVAMLSSDNIFINPVENNLKKKALQKQNAFREIEGDLLTLVNVYLQWQKTGENFSWTKENFLSYRSLEYAKNIYNQLVSLLKNMNIDSNVSSLPSKEPFLKCLTKGLCLNIAKRYDIIDNQKMTSDSNNRIHINPIKTSSTPQYKTFKGNELVFIHPNSVLFSSKTLPEYVTFSELLVTTKQYMRNINFVDKSWLSEVIPHLIKEFHYGK